MNIQKKIKSNIHKAKNDFHLKELVKGSAIAMFFRALAILSGYLLFYLLAKYYGAEGVGFFSTVWTLIMVSVVFSKLGFDTSIVKYIAEFSSKNEPHNVSGIYFKSINFITISGILVTLTMLFFSKDLSQIFFNSETYGKYIFYLSFGILPLTFLNFNAETQKALKKITVYSILQNGSINLFLSFILLVLVVFQWTTGLNTIIYALLTTIILLMFISFIFTVKNIGYSKPSSLFPLTNRKILKTTIPMLLSNSLFLIMNWTDTLMLSAFKSETDVGIYNTSLKIASLTTIVLIGINTIAMPKYAELKNELLRFRKFVKQTTFLIILSSLPIFLGIVFFPDYLLKIFGNEFVGGQTTLLILATGMFFSAISGSTVHILNMTGYEKIVQNILLFSAVLNFILNFILIPLYGISGAAIATATTTIFWNLITQWFIYKKFKFVTFPFI